MPAARRRHVGTHGVIGGRQAERGMHTMPWLADSLHSRIKVPHFDIGARRSEKYLVLESAVDSFAGSFSSPRGHGLPKPA